MAKALARANGHSENRLTSRWATRNKPTPPVAPVAPESVEIKGRILATFGDYDGLHAAVRARVAELGFTREIVGTLSGVADGYAGKILGLGQRSGGGGPVKKFGRQSLAGVLGAVGTYLVLIENPGQVAKLKAVADALTALSHLAALGVDRAEFERIAGLGAVPPPKASISAIGDTLEVSGARLALVENPEATAKMLARASARRSVRRSPVLSERSANVCS